MTALEMVHLAIGVMAMSMGIAVTSFAFLLLFHGDFGGLFGLVVGAMNLFFGCLELRRSGFLD